MSYEPRIGDLVQTAAYGDAVVVDGTSIPGFWRYHWGDKVGCAHISRITPLRPDAPGQRVRSVRPNAQAPVRLGARGTVLSLTTSGRGAMIEWDHGAVSGPHMIDPFLIRIADQAPAAPVEAL